MHTAPSGPIGATTPLATTDPATKLTFDATGCGVPHGQTVMYPAPDGWTAVTLIATAVAPAGITSAAPLVRWMAAPIMGTRNGAAGSTRARGAPIALRVSTKRDGMVPTNASPPTPPANHPAMSTSRWLAWFE